MTIETNQSPSFPNARKRRWFSKDFLIFGLGFWLSLFWIVTNLVLALSTFFIEWPSPLKQNYSAITAGPGGDYLLGTDHLGRDLLSRVIHGARVSFSVAFSSPLIGMSIGLILSLIHI